MAAPFTKEQAKAKIAELVKTFDENKGTLQKLQEAMIENNYLRPLFRALNWNVNNEGIGRPSEYEFHLQDRLRTGKKPDYILRLNGHDLLVMDAKMAKYSMKDPRWQWQVYRYAYSTQNYSQRRCVDFGVLTDFEEFILLDCTKEAKNPSAVNNFRALDWRYTDYVEKFDALWDIFERNNMLEASRDRKTGLWACYLSPKQAKANRVPPDKGFLAKLDDEKDGWRVCLAKDMKKRNPSLTGDVITAAVQLLIDRLVFIKALSDREIEDDYLTDLAKAIEADGLRENDCGWFAAAQPVFAKLNRFYNGSIFAPRIELESVTTSNRVVRSILREMEPDRSPYDLGVLPVHILGTIYERFLGKVVRTTDQRVKIEEKPEVRKAGGVFYTPEYIVNYIVEQTVGKLLADCKTPEDVAKLKILDPACGSGSFLIGAYDALIEWHKNYYKAKAKPDRGAAYLDADGEIRLTAKLKRQILIHNIFGVDIDAQAVEVTRFSLSLKALEDTRKEELDEERNLFKETVLPDLKDNIGCGNSLIERDIEQQLKLIQDEERDLELKRINPMSYREKFPEIMAQGGFDAIIGNPPYIRIQTMQETSPASVAYLASHYRTAAKGNYDIYVVFVECGLSLLNPKGLLGFILPHKFFNAQYGEALRAHLAKGKHVSGIVHFGAQQVFAGATTYTCLLFLEKSEVAACRYVNVVDLETWQRGGSSEEGSIAAERFTSGEWNYTVGHNAGLCERLQKMPVKLGDVANIFVGLQTSADDVFILDLIEETPRTLRLHSKISDDERTLEKGLLFPLVSGTDVRGYGELPRRQYIIFPYLVADERAELLDFSAVEKQYPKTAAYLLENKKRLEQREKGCFNDREWYRFGRSQNLGIQSRVKLCVPRLVDRLHAAWDANGEHFLDNVDVGGVTLKPEYQGQGLPYLLSLLNSRLLAWYFPFISAPFRGGWMSANRQFLSQLPFRPINFSDAADKSRHDKLVGLVEQMLDAKKRWVVAQTEKDKTYYAEKCQALDKQIDALVYELYKLTDDEIKIVEENTK